MENDVALGGLQTSIDLSRQTAESWAQLWQTAISADSGLWSSLVALGLTLAALSILYVAITTGKEVVERQSWSELVSIFIWPLVILFFLGGNGRLLAQTTLLIRGIGNNQVVQVLQQQVSPAASSFGGSINDVGLTMGGREAIDRAYRECQSKTGEELNQCWTNATNRVQSIIAAAEQQAGRQLPELREYAANVANAVNIQATQNDQTENLGPLATMFNSFMVAVVQVILLGLQWAFVNMLEAALLLTALFAPIAMGLSLLPLQGRPIVAWLIGFISLFGVQLGYNIIVGLVAVVVSQAGAITGSDIAFMLFLAIFAPVLALLIAGSGGIALYQGVQSGVKTSLSFVSDVVGYTTNRLMARAETGRSTAATYSAAYSGSRRGVAEALDDYSDY